MNFLIGAGLLLVLVVALLAWALLRAPSASRGEDMEGRLEDELADDVAAGVLSDEDLPAAASDIDVEKREETRSSAGRHSRAGIRVWGVIALVVVAAVVVYWQKGNWRAAVYGDRAAVMHRATGMLARLQAHLEAHPDDKQGWMTLGRAKSAMGDYVAAASAYGKAVKLDHAQNPELLARWGEAWVLQDPKHLTRQEHAVFSAVLEADPDSVRGLWYGGLLALDAGQRQLAIDRWQRLLEQDIPPRMASFVTNRLHALGAGASQAGSSAAAGGPSIELEIKVAPALVSRLEPDETLFIYVRDPAGGPPLAARRMQAKDFPLRLTIGNDDAVIPGHTLAAMIGKEVEVGALVSDSGNASPEPGDLVGSRQVVLEQGRQTLALKIDRLMHANPGS